MVSAFRKVSTKSINGLQNPCKKNPSVKRKHAPRNHEGPAGPRYVSMYRNYHLYHLYLVLIAFSISLPLIHSPCPKTIHPDDPSHLLNPLTMTTPLISTRLASRATIVTGSSSGLGRAIALAFAANGASPIICSDLRPDSRGNWGVSEAHVPTHEQICRRHGEGKAVYVQADATIAEDMERVVKKAVEVGGRLDV